MFVGAISLFDAVRARCCGAERFFAAAGAILTFARRPPRPRASAFRAHA